MDPRVARALASLSTGIYVLTTRSGSEHHGMSSSWVTQVSGDPALLAIAVGREHRSHALLERERICALNVVGARSRHLEDYFFSKACQRPNNLDTIPHAVHASGVAVLAEVAVALVCRVHDVHPAGDHSLFIAAVEDVVLREPDAPLTSQDLDYVYVGEVVRR